MNEHWESYNNYMMANIVLKHDFYIVPKWSKYKNDKGEPIPWNNGWGKPDKEYENFALYYLWEDFNIMEYSEFVKMPEMVKHYREAFK